MTSDNLLKFLGNREYMHQVSYQELKSMVVQYPYSLSLRYLLAMKSQQEDNTDVDRNIELLSTYGIDRSHLHRVFSEDPIVLEDLEESILMGEDFLELKELSALERDLGEKLVVNEVGALNFSQEEVSQEIPLPIPATDLPLPPPIIDVSKDLTSAEIETILVDETALVEEISNVVEVNQPAIPLLPADEIKQIIPTEKEEIKLPEEIIELEEEEFITLDFEDEVTAEISEKAGNESVPSAAFTANEIIEDANNLPDDAVEINDYTSNAIPVITDNLVEELFEAAEAEAIAEAAISDSTAFMEHPATILEAESELIVAETIVTENSSIETAAESLNTGIETKEKALSPLIPFEVEFSEKDPVTIASIQEGTDIVLPEEEESISEEEFFNNTPPTTQATALNATAAINHQEIESKEEVTENTPVEAEIPASNIVETQEIESQEETTENTPVEVDIPTSNIVEAKKIGSQEETTENTPVEADILANNMVETKKTENQEEIAESAPVEVEMPASNLIDTQEIENQEEIAESAPVEVLASNLTETKEIVIDTSPTATIEKVTLKKEQPVTPAKINLKFNSLDQLEASFSSAKKIVKPAPKAKFNSWQEQYANVGQFSSINLMPVMNGKGKTIQKKRKTTRKKFAKTVAFAEESLQMDTVIVSETLAQLLVRQGQYSKASAMYEQLCLIMPKKSGFFAGEIEKIQNLPDEDS